MFSDLSPSQHGPDLLGVLSSLIDKNTQCNHSNAALVLVVSLALDGIKYLCEAEVGWAACGLTGDILC